MKFLLWFGLALVVIYLLRKKKSLPPSTPAPMPDAQVGEQMVRCVHCGVFVPQSESVTSEPGQVFCSTAHRALHAPV